VFSSLLARSLEVKELGYVGPERLEMEACMIRFKKALESHRVVTVCSYCGKTLDKHGKWTIRTDEVDSVELSHGICPECMKKYFPDLAEAIHR